MGITTLIMKPSITSVRIHLKIIRGGSSDFWTDRTITHPMIRPNSSRKNVPRMIWPVSVIRVARNLSSSSLAVDEFGMAGAAQGGVVGDQALTIKIVKTIIHQ